MAPPKTFVIGDIHGCIDELNYLLDAIAPTSDDTVCFLGDYIDRGPSPKAVIDRLIRLQTEGPTCVFLKGNHEDMLLAYLVSTGTKHTPFLFGDDTTIEDFGLPRDSPQAAIQCFPRDHFEFLLNLRDTWYFKDFLCVHAGVRPDRSLKDQHFSDYYWIRDGFIKHPHPFPYTVIFGHTVQQEVFLHLPYKIGLDTGVAYGNKLSCLELREKDLFQIDRWEKEVTRRSLVEEFTQSQPPPNECRSLHR